MPNAVIAILSGHEQSVRCADALKLGGFTRDEISILLPDDFGAQELGYVRKNRAVEGIVIGMFSGGLLGAVFASLVIHFQLSLQPASLLLAGGALSTTLATSALFALTLGLLCGIIGMSMSEYAVRKFDRKTKMASSIIAVHTDNPKEMRLVQKILRLEGAQDIGRTEEENDRRKPVQLAAH